MAYNSMPSRTVKSAKAEEPDYEAHFCLPSDPHNARGFGRKVYGVCTILRKDFATKHNHSVRTVDWDLEGRIQVVETEDPKLSIWNIYAVNGTDNPYKDSKTGAITGTRHDRKLAVHKHMLEEAKALEARGYGVIIAGDLNIARSRLDGVLASEKERGPSDHVPLFATFDLEEHRPAETEAEEVQ
ncbi:unnamed protein product [Aureobasidium pullulans]|nr:unnamed protein product [Aureobasidium pullulans]